MPKKPAKKPTAKPTKKETALAIPEEHGKGTLTTSQKEAMKFLAPLCPELPHYFETRKEMAKFCSTAFIAIKREPKLLKCEPSSIALAISKAASLKLEVAGPLQHCWPIPFKDKCQLLIGYRAWVLLILRNSHGFVKWINAEVVREKDKFIHELGANPQLRHFPAGDESAMTHAYAVAGLANGQTVFKVLNKKEVMKAKACSRGADKADSPWKNHEPEMWKKTAILRIAKILPIDSEEFSEALGHEQELSDFSQEPEGSVTVIPPKGGGVEKLKQAISTPPASQPLTVGMEEEGEKPKGLGLFNCKACGKELAAYGEHQAVCVNTECDDWNKPIEA
jgi:phage RecT family recombinase